VRSFFRDVLQDFGGFGVVGETISAKACQVSSSISSQKVNLIYGCNHVVTKLKVLKVDRASVVLGFAP